VQRRTRISWRRCDNVAAVITASWTTADLANEDRSVAAAQRAWRMPWVLRAFGVLFMPCLVFVCYVAFRQWSLGDPGTPLWVAMLVTASCILLGSMFYAYFLRPQVVLSDDELEIRNWGNHRRVPLAGVVDAASGPGGTAFRLADGAQIGATALQKGLGADLLKIQTRTDRAVATILAAARARRGQTVPRLAESAPRLPDRQAIQQPGVRRSQARLGLRRPGLRPGPSTASEVREG
jgi:hypothetical protein